MGCSFLASLLLIHFLDQYVDVVGHPFEVFTQKFVLRFEILLLLIVLTEIRNVYRLHRARLQVFMEFAAF